MSISRLALCSGGGEAWDIGLTQYNPPESLCWDIATAKQVKTFSVAAQEANPTDVSFKPDGTKMYVLGNSGNDVNEYNLSTAWDITTAVYSQNFSVAAQEANPTGLFFKPDGLKMYIIGSGIDAVNEYNLSTAWNITTAVYSQNFSVAAQEANPTGLFFKPDGLKMYVVGFSGQDVNEYNLSTPWNITTAVYSQNFGVGTQEIVPTGLFFKPDGLKMYIIGTDGDDINEYNLSTAWNITTAVYSKNFSLAGQESSPQGLFFKPDGSKMYVMGQSSLFVIEYVLGGFSVAAQTATPTGLFFKPDGTKMYVVGSVSGAVNEYNLSTFWDISTATLSQSFTVTGVRPGDLYFRSDGLRLFVTGGGGSGFETKTLRSYNLSVAWDISTASASAVYDFATNFFPDPTALFFKDDGTRAYIIFEPASNLIRTAILNTPWDVSTITTVPSSSSVPAGSAGIFFRQDGTKFYVVPDSSDNISEYDLTTPWVLSTKVLNQTFSVSNEGPTPQGIFFRPDGKAFYTIDSLQKIYQYSIG